MIQLVSNGKTELKVLKELSKPSELALLLLC